MRAGLRFAGFKDSQLSLTGTFVAIDRLPWVSAQQQRAGAAAQGPQLGRWSLALVFGRCCEPGL